MKTNQITFLKKSNFLIILVLFIFSSCSNDEGKIIFAVSAKIYPFEFYENNELAGFDIEFAKLIAKELNKEPIFKDVYYYNIFNLLQNSSVDASISSHILTQKRSKQFLFSKIYQKSQPTLVYNSKFNNILSIKDMKNKKISPFYGSMFNEWFLDKIGPDVQKVYYNDELSASKALENGLIDILMLDRFEAIYLIKKNSDLRIADLGLDFYLYELDENLNKRKNYDFGFAIILNKKNNDLLQKINFAIEKLEKEGKIDELRKKFLFYE